MRRSPNGRPLVLRGTTFVALFCTVLVAAPRAQAAVPWAVSYTDATNTGFKDPALGPSRKNCFEAAVANWAQRLNGTQTVQIDAKFTSQGGTPTSATLGQAGAHSFINDFSGSPAGHVFYPVALANQLAHQDTDPPGVNDTGADIDAEFNSDVDNGTVLGGKGFYYGTDGNNANHIDFYSVALHELCHGFGFISTVDQDGSYVLNDGTGARPCIFDTFLVNGPGSPDAFLVNLTQAQRSAVLVSNSLYFQGANADAGNGGPNPKLYGPATYEPGSSTSHLDESTFHGINELMTPYMSAVDHDPGPVAFGIMLDLGWQGTAAQPTPTPTPTAPPPSSWTARDISAGSDNKTRALWTNQDGRLALWVIAADGSLEVNNSYGPYSGWTARSLAMSTDNKMRVLWANSNGTAAIWQVGTGNQTAGGGALEINSTYGPYAGWQASAIAVGPDNKTRVLWNNTNGTAALWVIGSNGGLEVNNTYGPYSGWAAASICEGPDNKFRVLWNNTNGASAIWLVALGDQTAGGGGLDANVTYGPYSGWAAQNIGSGPDGKLRVLWDNTNGQSALWVIGGGGSLDVNNTYGPYAGWADRRIAVGADNQMRALWTNVDLRASFWVVTPGTQSAGGGALASNFTYGPY